MVAARIPFPQRIPTHNTNTYLQVIREADTTTSFSELLGPGGPGADGKLSRQELSQYTSNLSQQKQFMEMFGNFFQQFLGFNPFQNQLQELNSKLEVAGIMQNNYEKFSGSEGRASFDPFEITATSVVSLAGRDGNASDVTQRDIQGGPFPYPLPQPRLDYSNNQQLGQKMQQHIPANSPYSPILQDLVGLLSNVEPESPQALALQARIATIAQQAGIPEKDQQSIFLLSGLRSLNNISGSLVAISGNLDPQSPQAAALRARLQALDGIRNSLIQNYERLNPPFPTYYANQPQQQQAV